MIKSNKTNKNDKAYKYNQPFPSLLRELRDKYKVSQEEIAKALNTSRQTISNYALGETLPDIYSAEKIVDFFNKKYNLNYSLDYWLGKEKLSSNTKKKELSFSNNTLELLKKYQSTPKLMLTIEILLSNESFLNTFAEYIVSANMRELINENSDWFNFVLYSAHIIISQELEKKYKYYDILEKLPSIAEESKKYLLKYLETKKDVMFEYIDEVDMRFLGKNFDPQRPALEDRKIGEIPEYSFADPDAYEITKQHMKSILESPINKQLTKEYIAYEELKQMQGGE